MIHDAGAMHVGEAGVVEGLQLRPQKSLDLGRQRPRSNEMYKRPAWHG